ncbi:MAG: tRNA uridine-5-carboxymethylaminomethyl(34) synthesis enzyme MnmG [Bacilli bacterium]|jgi:tRNA uridine 5-carboxymethylaminomethyl modification enzyme
MKYDVIVVGGGHAGCEAALACAHMNHNTLLVTGNIKNIATMPCNPSIGGSAKGIVVREIDALGGMMGKIADKAQIQMKMLNSAKGPAVRSLRAQADKILYPKMMLETLKHTNNLTIKEGMVEDLIVENQTAKGVILSTGEKIASQTVILTTGTYLKSSIMVGNTRTSSGPSGEKSSLHLSDNLKRYGFEILRLKTGTPQRIKRDSIDFNKTKIEKGDDELLTFSFDDEPNYKIEDQEPCYLTYTTPLTHQIIKDNLSKSSMYGGLNDITGVGPRYCPSIEDKVTRFADKERHQLFLEPESRYYDDIYLQGFSTSMPHDIQELMVHSLPGLENAVILKYAYAIEYDAIYPTQLKPSLETKILDNLFTAGQINGTSGYEEAACQGLIAGINASLKLEGKEPLILKRNEAYIGVLIDDLVTKGTLEPYRLLTSRAEYRLLLRDDNADLRIREYGYKFGLIDEEKYQKLLDKKKRISDISEKLKTTYIKEYKTDAYTLLKRPEIKINDINEYINEKDKTILEQIEISIKYEGYINKTIKEAEKMIKEENKLIPHDIDYNKIANLASEARQKLNKIRPLSLGQALRISGVNPADISILAIYLRKYYPYE